ncbi:hypothetical protein HDV02_005860 [Globomyces sp. JEL0801]|nr:hypothetical protein HDV02_005860 [Globomyces sp. JEL0801]
MTEITKILFSPYFEPKAYFWACISSDFALLALFRGLAHNMWIKKEINKISENDHNGINTGLVPSILIGIALIFGLLTQLCIRLRSRGINPLFNFVSEGWKISACTKAACMCSIIQSTVIE